MSFLVLLDETFWSCAIVASFLRRREPLFFNPYLNSYANRKIIIPHTTGEFYCWAFFVNHLFQQFNQSVLCLIGTKWIAIGNILLRQHMCVIFEITMKKCCNQQINFIFTKNRVLVHENIVLALKSVVLGSDNIFLLRTKGY